MYLHQQGFFITCGVGFYASQKYVFKYLKQFLRCYSYLTFSTLPRYFNQEINGHLLGVFSMCYDLYHNFTFSLFLSEG